MKDYQKQRLSEAMRRTADNSRCPRCGRGAAMVMRQDANDRHYTQCRWISQGKCEATPETDTRLIPNRYRQESDQ